MDRYKSSVSLLNNEMLMTQKRVGRPRVCPMVSNWIKTLRAEGHSYDDIAKITGMSKATCWRYAKDIEIKRETYFLSLISATFPILALPTLR